MQSTAQQLAISRAHELRRDGGKWLKEKREQANLSQRQLAAKVGAEYYTLISQLETGRGRIPSDQYLLWAEALDVPAHEFVLAMMRFYDPVTYEILFRERGLTS
jgi:transcriptional regulator with XRE-family HTH domain